MKHEGSNQTTIVSQQINRMEETKVTKSKATKTAKSKVTKPAAPKPALAKTTTAKTTAATAKVVEAPAATSKMFTGTLTKSQRQAIRLKRRHEKGIQKGASSAKRIKTEDSSKLTSFLSDYPDETFGGQMN